jgi:hypothetical protein
MVKPVAKSPRVFVLYEFEKYFEKPLAIIFIL